MKQRMTTIVAVAVLLGTVPAAAEKVERNFHESFDVEPGAVLHLVHGDGDVRVTPWDRDVIDVEVRYRAELGGVVLGGGRDLEVEFRQSGKVVHVIAKQQGVTLAFGYSRTLEHTYTVQAPPWVELDFEGDDGDVRVRDWSGEIAIELDDGDLSLDQIASPRTRIQMQDGDVQIAGITGALDIELDDGDVRVTDCRVTQARVRAQDGDVDFSDCSGRFDVTSDDGDIELSRTKAEELMVRTEDGTVEADLQGAGPLRAEVRTDDGDVLLTLDRAISASFEVRTGDGGIHVDLDAAQDVVRERRRASGRLGSGEGSIVISTEDGAVRLRDGFSSD